MARLLLRVLAIIVVAIAITFIVIHSQMDKSLDMLREKTVAEQARNIQEYLKPGKGANKLVMNLPTELRLFYARAVPTAQYLVRDADGEILFKSSYADTSFFPSDFGNLGDGSFTFKGANNSEYVGMTVKATVGDTDYYVQTAQTLQVAGAFSSQIIDEFTGRLLMIGLPFCAAVIVIIMTTVRRGFDPLYRAAKQVARMGAPSPSGLQIDEKGIAEEILPFIRAINFSFRRLGKSLQEQKELTENLAHELRTPLAVLKAHIEQMPHSTQSAKLLRDVDEMINLMNQMLDITRLDYADTIEMKMVDLSELVSRVCQDLWPLFIKEQRELRVHGVEAPVFVLGDRDLIYRAIRNLLDNALEHTPAKTPVDVTLEGTSVKVRDYGLTIPEARRENIFDRFRRGTNGDGQAGAGLGLSIVSKTMAVHNGAAAVEAGEESGNVFILDFRKTPYVKMDDSV
ncbi:MAG: sensor histidine kinase [Alphaproteobacteria bacterium]